MSNWCVTQSSAATPQAWRALSRTNPQGCPRSRLASRDPHGHVTVHPMNRPKTDIEPEIDPIEEDDDQPLPEAEDEAAAGIAGALTAGRKAIIAHGRHAPPSPGVYRMIDAQGDVLYVGKAKNIRKRIIAYARPTGHDTRIMRMIAATANIEFVSTRTET